VTVHASGRDIRFALDDPMDEIQRVLVGGSFYEHDQLEVHRGLIPRHGRVLDLGANVGNHAVFYAAVCEAELVVAVEPARRAWRLLKKTVKDNALCAIELHTGVAAGAGSGWALIDARESYAHNLGGTSVKIITETAPGAIPVQTGDDILAGRSVDFVKIDVEGSEMQALTGLQRTVDVCRPVVAVEVAPVCRDDFTEWCANNRYRIERSFQMYRGIWTYVCLPL